MSLSSTVRSLTGATVAVALVASPAAAAPTEPTEVTELAARWIDAQFTTEGSVIGRTGEPDVPNTIAATLALDAVGHRPADETATVAYVEAGFDDYVAGGIVDDYGPLGSGDRPGPLANVLLFADALDLDPRDFANTDVVARLEETEQHLGPDAGSYGLQVDVWGHGYAHATAVWALASTATAAPSDAAVAHLLDLQCDTGGFPSGYRNAVQRVLDDCTGDSNATGLALAALSTVDGHEDAAARAITFLADTRNPDGGWGYTPGSATDGNSTGLAALGLRLADEDVTAARATIASFQLGCDAPDEHRGGIRFLASDDEPNSFATFQAALAFDVASDHEPTPTCSASRE